MSGFIGVYNYPRVEFNYASDTFTVKIGDQKELEKGNSYLRVQNRRHMENPTMLWHASNNTQEI
jgi:hypothetical protein